MNDISKVVYRAINNLMNAKTSTQAVNAVRGLKLLSDGVLDVNGLEFQVNEGMSQQSVDFVRKEFVEAGLLNR